MAANWNDGSLSVFPEEVSESFNTFHLSFLNVNIKNFVRIM